MEETDQLLESYQTELRRGVVVLAVLSRLGKPAYGYEIIRSLADFNFPVDGNTAYPLLRRLEEQGLLSSEWDTSTEKPRKYYRMTRQGQQFLEKLKDYWYRSIASLHTLLEDHENGK
ncbi:MAG: PadR family transcriptional regulator [Anaerolineaceae bacterium]|jgi:PadR family transcriptional regulator PadR